MKRYLTPTFFKFLFGFLIIVALAFAALAFVGSENAQPVDNIAVPQ